MTMPVHTAMIVTVTLDARIRFADGSLLKRRVQ